MYLTKWFFFYSKLSKLLLTYKRYFFLEFNFIFIIYFFSFVIYINIIFQLKREKILKYKAFYISLIVRRIFLFVTVRKAACFTYATVGGSRLFHTPSSHHPTRTGKRASMATGIDIHCRHVATLRTRDQITRSFAFYTMLGSQLVRNIITKFQIIHNKYFSTNLIYWRLQIILLYEAKFLIQGAYYFYKLTVL